MIVRGLSGGQQNELEALSVMALVTSVVSETVRSPVLAVANGWYCPET